MADEKCKVAKEYLLQVKRCDAQINNKLDDLACLEGMVMKITSTWKQDVTFGSGSQDKLGDTMARIMDLRNEIDADVDTLIDKKREISATIEQVQNADQLRVLHLLYFGVFDPESDKGIKYLSWEEIGEEMHMTARNVQLIHGRALQAVSSILGENNTPIIENTA